MVSVHFFAGSDLSRMLPLWFIPVLFLLARQYGFAVGVIGALLCAFVFAHFLFDPTGSWHVDDAAARRNLLWMIAGVTVISYLLIPPSSQRKDSLTEPHSAHNNRSGAQNSTLSSREK